MTKLEELKRQKRIHGLPEVVSEDELKQLHKGVPIQKIIGFINFDNLQINVDRNVLIPRYETEEVVHEALKHIHHHSHVLDLCCGSGYIGLTVKQKTNAHVTCSDIDHEALLQTKENAQLNNLDVKIVHSDLFENLNEKFDVIISNPPYIPSHHKLDSSVLEHEPHHALFAGQDGNDIYRRIILEAADYIKKNGWLILEISPDNVSFLEEHGFKIKKDMNGKERIAIKQY